MEGLRASEAWCRCGVVTALALLTLVGCEDRARKPRPSGATTKPTEPGREPKAAEPRVAQPQTGGPNGATTNGSATTAAGAEKDGESGPEPSALASSTAPGGSAPFRLSGVFAIAPGGPAAALPDSVLLVDRADGLLRFRRKGTADKPDFEGYTGPPDRLNPYLPPPTVMNGFVYFASQQRLWRRKLEGGELEVLASDAVLGTRVNGLPGATLGALPKGSPRAAVVYLAKQKEDVVARLWVEGAGTTLLTPEGAGAKSVTLTRAGSQLLALTLDGRASMSPVHARTVDVGASGAPRLGADEVVWVASGSLDLSELGAIAGAPHATALFPIQGDAGFGLARVDLGEKPSRATEVRWETYVDGIDPSPVTGERVCDRDVVFYVVPAERGPTAPQELRAGTLRDGALSDVMVVNKARRYLSVSVAPNADGATLVYVADGETRVQLLRCATAAPAATASASGPAPKR